MDKENFLNEIKRTAGANGGRALGELAFYKQTGITKTDMWRYWARFSYAVKEAGFQPNTFQDQKQFSDDDLLAMYAKFAQERGCLPSNGDIRFKKGQDSSFPGSKTYEQRFGSKLELVSRLATFCVSTPEHADVLAWCQEYILKNPSITPEGGVAAEEAGYVYLVKMGKFYKIGRTNNVIRRGGEIALQMPQQATAIHCFRTDDPPGIEAYWHRRFADKRRNGEWFELSGKDIAAFKRRKTFM